MRNAGRGASRDIYKDDDLKFRIYQDSDVSMLLEAASDRDLATLPPLQIQTASWLMAYDDWMQPYIPELEYTRLMEKKDLDVHELLYALDLPGADITDVIARMCALKSAAAPAVSVLLPLIQDVLHMVRLRAVQALGSIGGAAAAPAVPELIRVLSIDEPLLGESFQRYTIEALGNIGPDAKSAIPQIIEYLDSEQHEFTQFRAAMALCQIDINSPVVQAALVDAIISSGERGLAIARHVSSYTPENREWIDIFIRLYEEGHLPMPTLRRIYFSALPDDQKRFPVQFDRYSDG
jgi:hypothetical protein